MNICIILQNFFENKAITDSRGQDNLSHACGNVVIYWWRRKDYVCLWEREYLRFKISLFLLLKPPWTDRPLRWASIQGEGAEDISDIEKQMLWVSLYVLGIAWCPHPSQSDHTFSPDLDIDRHLQPSQKHKDDLQFLCVSLQCCTLQSYVSFMSMSVYINHSLHVLKTDIEAKLLLLKHLSIVSAPISVF